MNPSQDNLPKMSRHLTTKLSSMKKTMTTKTRAGASRISDAQTLYISVLTAVSIPVLGVAPTNQSSNLQIKASNNSVVKGNTIYVCQSSMGIVQQKVMERATLMQDIPTVEASTFSRTGKKANQDIFSRVGGMTDVKTLIDQLAFICQSELKGLSDTYPLSPIEFDEVLYKTVELFLAIIKEVVQTEKNADYQVRKHPLLRTHTLKKQVSKYFLTSSQLLEDLGADLTIGVRDLFGISTTMHSASMKTIKAMHSDAAVFKQMTIYLEQLSRGTCPGYLKYDFESEHAYHAFVERETKHFSSLLAAFGQNYPSAPAAAGTARLGVNMPADHKTAERYYKVLVSLCFEHDLAESSGVLSLSKLSKSILNECAVRWNLCKEFKDAAIFDAVVKKYAAGTLSLTELYPFFKNVLQLTKLVAGLRKSDVFVTNLERAAIEFV
jgi:hypothetical protein